VGPGVPGVVAPIAVDSAGSGIVYAASIGSGGLRKSTDGGATWSAVGMGITDVTSSGIAAYSIGLDGPDTAYVGVFAPNRAAPAPDSSGVYKTTDGGATWTLLPNNVGIFIALATDPHTPGVIYEGALDGFINKSTNGGGTWVRSRNGTAPIAGIVIDPANTNIVYAATIGGGLLKTTDAGLTWTVLPGLPTTAIWGVGIDPSNDSVVYAATNSSGVWRSANGGATWQPTGAIGATPYGFAVDSSSHMVFAATTAGVWQSLDDGANWTQTKLTDRMTFSVVVGPGDVLYAGTAFGPEISTDSGATWTDPDPSEGGGEAFGYAVTVDPNTHKVLASTLGATAMISDNRVIDWHPVGVDYAARESRAIRVDPTDSNRVYSGSFHSGVFKSEDGGATWSQRTFGSGFPYVWVVVPDPTPNNNNILYAGTQGEGFWKSYDYGATWTQHVGMPRNVQGITVDPRNDNEVFFATPSGVLRSHDGGETFTNVLPRPAWSITIVGGDSQVVYVTTKTFGVYRSEDGGSSFTAINNGLTSLVMGRAAPVLVEPEHPNVLYVGTETAGTGGGAFKSFNGGDSWTAINDGLGDHAVFGMAMDTDRPGLLYIAGPSGIYRTTTGGQ
jgi:photosystem II stability/assembly factor-like uncharacterized protein